MVQAHEWSSFRSRQLNSDVQLATDSEDSVQAIPFIEQSSQQMGTPFTIRYKVGMLVWDNLFRI